MQGTSTKRGGQGKQRWVRYADGQDDDAAAAVGGARDELQTDKKGRKRRCTDSPKYRRERRR